MPYLESEQKFHQRNGSVDMKIIILTSNGHFVLRATASQNGKKSIMDNFFHWMAKLMTFIDSLARNHVETIKMQAFIIHFTFLKNHSTEFDEPHCEYPHFEILFNQTEDLSQEQYH